MVDNRQFPDPARQGRHAQGPAGGRGDGAPARPSVQGRRAAPRSASRAPGPTSGAARVPAGTRGAAANAPQGVGRPPANTARSAYRPAAGAPAPGAYRPAQTGSRPTGAAGGRGGRPSAAKPPNKKKGGLWRVVFWIALVVLAASLAALGFIAFSYWQGQQVYDEVAEQGFTAPEDIEGTALADLTVDWDALKAINPDTVGWVYVPGTVINYPIVHTDNNEYYLSRNFEGSEGLLAKHGAIFLAAENSADFADPNNLVYGHNMRDGSMFAAITGFPEDDQFNAHRSVYILTPQGNYRLQTFSLVHCAADDPLAQMTFSGEEERVAYVQDKIDRSIVEVSDIPAAAEMTKTFALSTCDSLPTDGRYVLFAHVVDSTVGTEGGSANPDDVVAVDGAAQEMAS